jgi:outer membrane protein assembly factor BamD (BamD/ComL family)
MPKLLSSIIGLLMIIGTISLLGWLIWRSIKNSDDPPKLIFKWVLTFVLGGAFLFAILRSSDPIERVVLVFAAVGFGVVMSIVWAPQLGSLIAQPFTSLFDGGTRAPDPEPFYSVATAKRKKGQFREAIYDIQQELARFPNDFKGQMMLAEIQAENLSDLQAAEVSVRRICDNPAHQPKSVAYALTTLGDWHLKYAQDTERARQCFEQIIEKFPGTEYSHIATQRIAHLGGADMHLGPHERRTISMRSGVEDIGLMRDSSVLAPPEEDLASTAARYVKHLEQHPQDDEVREKLAMIYAEHYKRVDLAAMQLEELIQQPNQPPQKVARWLNLLADLHIKMAQDIEAARATLQRVSDLYPGLSHAQLAEQRIAYLALEIKGKEKGHAVKMGTYETDLGLKRKKT